MNETVDGNCTLVIEIQDIVSGATKTNPVHWTVLTKRFVEGGAYSNDELVAAVNSLLLPFGTMHGANHNYWFE